MKIEEPVTSEQIILTFEYLLASGTSAMTPTWPAAKNFVTKFPSGARDPLVQPPKPLVEASVLTHSI